ncbi:MAG: ATP-binding protein [Planctomycetota bacterium]
MMPTSTAVKRTPRLGVWLLFLALCWTILIAGLACWDYRESYLSALAIVQSAAGDGFAKDQLYRRWASVHGGVYVPITAETPPSPYLAHIPDRDITTPSGKKLTLMNPAYMTRQVHELGKRVQGVQGHITSLKPLRPENVPDAWEKTALLAFERGEKQVSSIETLGNDRYLRLMRPLATEPSCLKCHASQGYQVGDIRGGISVSVPWASSQEAINAHFPMLIMTYGGIGGIGILGLFVFWSRIRHNLSNLKLAAEELLQAKNELQQYASELESNNQALEELNRIAESATRAKSKFLANMSHEIRTPMTAILGYADLLQEEVMCCHICPDSTHCQKRHTGCEAVSVIKRNGEHLLGLINDILDLSKVEAGKMQIEPICCSPCELLAEVASLMRVRAAAKHLTLKIEQDGPLPETILTDPLRLRQVLVNLVGNAIKFTDHGEVRITVRLIWGAAVSAARAGETPAPQVPGPRLRFDVTDTGIGMNEEQIGKLFQAFSQVDNSSTRKFGGTGLGLCISKRLAEAMGGKIEVHSTPGKGSTFRATIDPGPLDGIRMVQNAQEALLERPPTTTVVTHDEIKLSGRILLAEDGPDNQRFIAFVLKKAGAEVTLAENGQLAYDEALAALAQGRLFEVILMDMQMPVLDGYEATRQLREQGYSGPIVALTAHAMAEDRQKCLDAGCDDFATKPIDRQVLLTTVAHWMTPSCSGKPEAAILPCHVAP